MGQFSVPALMTKLSSKSKRTAVAGAPIANVTLFVKIQEAVPILVVAPDEKSYVDVNVPAKDIEPLKLTSPVLEMLIPPVNVCEPLPSFIVTPVPTVTKPVAVILPVIVFEPAPLNVIAINEAFVTSIFCGGVLPLNVIVPADGVNELPVLTVNEPVTVILTDAVTGVLLVMSRFPETVIALLISAPVVPPFIVKLLKVIVPVPVICE